jgi:hypothetical protein
MIKFTISEAIRARLRRVESRWTEVRDVNFNNFLRQVRGKVLAKVSGGSAALLNVKTGRLRDSIQIEGRTRVGGVTKGAVFAQDPQPYFYAHEKGHPSPYAIIATNARALRWMQEGKVRFAKQVTHPPIPAKRFFARTEEESRKSFRQLMQRAIDETLREP